VTDLQQEEKYGKYGLTREQLEAEVRRYIRMGWQRWEICEALGIKGKEVGW
jgi:hypothetical protein